MQMSLPRILIQILQILLLPILALLFAAVLWDRFWLREMIGDVTPQTGASADLEPSTEARLDAVGRLAPGERARPAAQQAAAGESAWP